uniref:CNH domain-containing protein n=1 Tax=Mesocestoides corti TaxID=53468 RepID=A0A5K3G2G1_MESCO
MHEAFYPIRLIRNNHYEFESISCFQNYLLIGTKTGQILFYEITPSVPRHPKAFIGLTAWPATTPSRPTEFTPLVEAESVDSVPSPLPSFNVRICATHNLCKKRVLQLQAVPEHGFFLALTEFQLAAYQLSDRQLIAVVPNSKGATHFAVMYQQPAASAKKQVSANTSLDKLKRRSNHTEEVALPSADDTSTLALNLCICVKRKLGFFRWSPLKKAFVSPSEANDPRIAFWPSEYTLPESARMLQFCGLETIIVALRSDYLRINLSTRESQVIVTPAKMSITLTAPLPYCLDAVTFDEEPQHLPDDATATPETKWVLGASAPVALASDEQLFTLLPGNADATATLAFDWSGIAQCLQPFPPYLLAGLSKQLEVRCLDPCDLVQTFAIPRVRLMCANDSGWLYAVAASSIFHPDDSQPDLSVKPVESPSAGHGSDVWLLLAANRPQLVQNLALKKDFEMALKVACFTRLSGQSPVSTSQLGALLAFHLFDEKRDFEGAFQLFYKLRTDPTIVIGLCPDLLREEDQARAQYPSAPRPLEDAEKKALLEPLIAFLVRWRNHLRSKCPRGDSLANFLAQSVACGVIVGRGPVEKQRSALLQVVDTSLVKCYLLTNVARVGPLLRRENYCHLEEVEKILTAHNCYEDLVTMYRARGMHRSALRCLTVMALGNDASQDTFAVSSDNRANHQPIVNYLKHLSDAPFDLVAEFGEWILRQHPRAWMSIFTAWERGLRHSASESKTIAYHDKAVRYLERVAPHLIIPFLERLIFTPFDCEQEDEEEEEGFEVLNGTAMFDNEGSEPDDFVAINGSPPPSSPSVRSLQAVTSTPKVLHGESSHAPAAHLVASNHGSTSSLSTATGSTHWQSSCLWPFPKHHHHLHRPRRCDVEQEGDSGNDGIPRICQPPPGAPPPVELHNRYARALM